MNENCPVCGEITEDMRHVAIECFYAVDEIVPSFGKKQIFQEVPMKSAIWGKTRTYSNGKIDDFYFGDAQILNFLGSEKSPLDEYMDLN